MSPVTATPAAPDAVAYMARGFRRPTTQSGRARLVALDDVDARAVCPGDVLVAEGGAGCGPVFVTGTRTGVAGEDPDTFEVPVIEATTLAGRPLAFDPRELARVVDRKGPVRA